MAIEIKYKPLDDESLEDGLYRSRFRLILLDKRISLVWTICTLIVAITSSLLAGYFLGRNTTTEISRDGLISPSGTVHEVWNLDQRFSSAPSPITEDAWNSIVPIGRGFIHHDTIAPFISNIAVFHQLHCLHGLRVAYYSTLHDLQVLNGSRTAEDEFIKNIGARTDAPHMHHCFDYLRRAIMCAADTNLEDISPTTRITTGWGVQRVCRDYEAVKAWAEQYVNSTDTGIL